MPFWTYILHCADRSFYVGHTEDLELRLAQHQQASQRGHTVSRLPVKLVWCSEFPSRYEALSAERQIKGWSRAKKMALIRDDWEAVAHLAKNRQEKEKASTGSARTGEGRTVQAVGAISITNTVRPEPVEGPSFLHDRPPECLPLKLHPDYRCNAVSLIEVEILRPDPASLQLRYFLRGSAADILIPAPAEPVRTDGLWRQTCFEAFVRPLQGEDYNEFNLSPSGRWATYRFKGYRDSMSQQEIAPPSIRTHIADDAFELEAWLEVRPGPLRLGLSAVIEEKNGCKSYWALAHPPGKADFHHPASFMYELP